MLDIALNGACHLIERLLDHCRETATRFAMAWIEAGAHATPSGNLHQVPTLVVSPVTTAGGLSLIRCMIGAFRAHGKVIAHHICGNVASILG